MSVTRAFVLSFSCSFVVLFVCSFFLSCVRFFVRFFVLSFVRSFVLPFVCSFFRSFVRSFVHSFARSFACSFLLHESRLVRIFHNFSRKLTLFSYRGLHHCGPLKSHGLNCLENVNHSLGLQTLDHHAHSTEHP